MKKFLKLLLAYCTGMWRWFKRLSRKGKYLVVGALLMVGVVGASSRPTPSPKPIVTPSTQETTQTTSQTPAQSVEPQVASGPSAKSLGNRTKTSGCVMANSLQDKACTPGAVFAGVTKEQVCVAGYSSSVRNVTESTKNAVYAEYGISNHATGEYEVDHLVSLELGGSNDISNLWPEPANPTPGFHQKDTVENSLHAKVCDGTMALQSAQSQIANNWLAVFNGSNQTITSQPVQASPAPQPTAGGGSDVYYANCTAAKTAGVTPIYRGQPGYRAALDRDGDGIACE